MKRALLVLAVCAVIFSQMGCGGSSSATVPPAPFSFASTPIPTAGEGQTYSYTMGVTGAGQNTVTFHLDAGPDGASISGSTLTWVPSSAQSRTANQFSVTATAGTATDQQRWSVTPTGTVQGTQIVSYVTDSRVTQQPDDTSQVAISASAPDGRGGFTTLSGTGSNTGTYSVASVPGGYYWLQNGPITFVWTNQNTVDTGRDTLGQPSRTFPTLPTLVDLSLTGLSPWQNGDEQQLYVPTSNSYLDYAWNLNVGDTSLYQQVPWTTPLLDASQGDTIYLSQLVVAPVAGGRSVEALSNSAPPITGITQPDGTEIELDAALESVDQENLFRGNIAGSVFAQLESGMNPSAIPDSSYAFLDVHPAGTDYGWIGNTPDLVSFDGTDAPIRTDTDMGDIAYGNPYPEGWEPFLDYVHYVRLDYTAPGAVNAITHYAYLELQTTTMPTVTSPVTPSVGPVVSPKINGLDLFHDQAAVGTMPILSWTAPALGTPTGYEVEVYYLYNNGGDSQADKVGDLYTKTTTIQVPPGMLSSGSSYYFRISTVAEPGIDYETAPFRHAFPRAVAQALTGVVTP